MAIWQSARLRPGQAAGLRQGPGQPPQTCRPLSGCMPITAPSTSRSGLQHRACKAFSCPVIVLMSFGQQPLSLADAEPHSVPPAQHVHAPRLGGSIICLAVQLRIRPLAA